MSKTSFAAPKRLLLKASSLLGIISVTLYCSWYNYF